MTREYLVYRMDFPNGKSYIGSRSAGPLETYWTSSKLVERYIAKHGTDGITKTVLCRCADADNLITAERVYQIANRVVEDDKFYNLRYAGDKFTVAGKERSAEYVANMSARLKKLYRDKTKHPAYGKPKSTKTKELISKANKGGTTDKNNKPTEVVFADGSVQIYGMLKVFADQEGIPESTCKPWARGETKPRPKRYPQIKSVRYLTPDEATEWKNGQNGR